MVFIPVPFLHRNLTLQGQLVVWGLAMTLGLMVLVLIILVGILLAGNSWISQGVERGKEIAWHTIPQVGGHRKRGMSSFVLGGLPPLYFPNLLPPSHPSSPSLSIW